jgi:hypothetical protein
MALNFSNSGGAGSYTDIAWRVWCDVPTDPLSITTWDQLAAALGDPDIPGTSTPWTGPSPDQPLVLWGPKNNSGTGATWYTFAGCTSANPTGIVPTNNLITENDAQQLSQYAAQDSSETITLNTAGCPTSTTCGPDGTPAAPTSTVTEDNCGGNGTLSTGLGTTSYTAANEACVAQEVADSLFFISYGYYTSHTYTAAVTIPAQGTASIGGQNPRYQRRNWPAGQRRLLQWRPGDPRATNVNAVATGRDLWLDYLTVSNTPLGCTTGASGCETYGVRASAAAFVNWVCDAGEEVAPKGVDLTTGQPIDNEITTSLGSWGFLRLNCDSEPGSTSTSYGSTITSAIIDPGPPNAE